MTFVERPNDDNYVRRMQRRHAAMTVRALVTVFEFKQGEAQNAVREMWDRFPEPELRERLLHEGPLNFAARIAKVNPASLADSPWADRVPKYRKDIKRIEKIALADHAAEAHFRRVEDRAHRLWEREGRPEGKADEHWLRAEAEVTAEEAAPDGTPQKSADPGAPSGAGAPKAR
jgi:hypothetical protein